MVKLKVNLPMSTSVTEFAEIQRQLIIARRLEDSCNEGEKYVVIRFDNEANAKRWVRMVKARRPRGIQVLDDGCIAVDGNL